MNIKIWVRNIKCKNISDKIYKVFYINRAETSDELFTATVVNKKGKFHIICLSKNSCDYFVYNYILAMLEIIQSQIKTQVLVLVLRDHIETCLFSKQRF